MNTRKIAVIVLSVMALALMIAAIAIAIQLANNQAPTDTGATPTDFCGPNYGSPGTCGGFFLEPDGTPFNCSATTRPCQPETGAYPGKCVPDLVGCSSTGDPNKCGGSGSSAGCGEDKSPGDTCLTGYKCVNQGVDTIKNRIVCYCQAQTTITPTVTTSVVPTTPTPTNTGCGPAGCDGDTRPQCYPYVAGSSQLSIENSDCSVKRTGDSCTQKNSSGTSTGVAGKCQNAPSCSCVANATPTPVAPVLHACGQNCNQGTGLCQAGFTCAFNNPTCQTNGIYNNTTYCVPNSVYAGLPKCASQYNNTDKYITNAGGAVTESYILSLCPANTTAIPTPLPTDAQGNVIPIPGTAVVSDKLDPILLGLLLVIFGVSLYPRIKFKRGK